MVEANEEKRRGELEGDYWFSIEGTESNDGVDTASMVKDGK
jgi:hypothetical protein